MQSAEEKQIAGPRTTADQRPRFTLHLEAQHRDNDPSGMLRLRAVLKLLLRAFGFKCRQIQYPPADEAEADEETGRDG